MGKKVCCKCWSKNSSDVKGFDVFLIKRLMTEQICPSQGIYILYQTLFEVERVLGANPHGNAMLYCREKLQENQWLDKIKKPREGIEKKSSAIFYLRSLLVMIFVRSTQRNFFYILFTYSLLDLCYSRNERDQNASSCSD